MELRTDDRLGLLSRVSSVIEASGVTVRWAKVATLGNTVVDTFCLTLPTDTDETRAALEEAVLAVCPVIRPSSDDDDAAPPTAGSSRSGVPIS
jgi:[protein-PII] uridylyltransferase